VVPPADDASELPVTTAGAGATAAADAAVAAALDPLDDVDLPAGDEPEPPDEHAPSTATSSDASIIRPNRCTENRRISLAPLDPRPSHISHSI
jgi:hypothetical protein